MFSVVFPGQGSQTVGMSHDFYTKYELFKKTFKEADEILNLPISKIIFEGPDIELNLTENTQPAIFLTSYSIFKVIQEEFGLNLKNAKFIGKDFGTLSLLKEYNNIRKTRKNFITLATTLIFYVFSAKNNQLNNIINYGIEKIEKTSLKEIFKFLAKGY